jgi:hypothetical protein
VVYVFLAHRGRSIYVRFWGQSGHAPPIRPDHRDAIRGTKTVLAVLAMLALVLAWGSAPVRADDNDGNLGRHKVRVLT